MGGGEDARGEAVKGILCSVWFNEYRPDGCGLMLLLLSLRALSRLSTK